MGSGHEPAVFPAGTGKLVPKNARVIAQIHYSARGGQIEADRSRIGLYFTKPPVEKRIMADAMAMAASRSRRAIRTTACRRR